MAKIKLENTSKAAIVLAITETSPEGKEIFSGDQVTVPRFKVEEFEDAAGEKHTRTIFGTAEVDSEAWEKLKKNKVVATYLSSGRLRVAGSAGPPPAASPPSGGKTTR
jgi:hypothetical protein